MIALGILSTVSFPALTNSQACSWLTQPGTRSEIRISARAIDLGKSPIVKENIDYASVCQATRTPTSRLNVQLRLLRNNLATDRCECETDRAALYARLGEERPGVEKLR